MEIEPGLESKVNALAEKSVVTLFGQLGIKFIYMSKDKTVATMPVDKRTHQPFGLLHGGASVALAETLASTGAWLNVDESKYAVVGLEINANHIRAVRKGMVTGTGIPLHKGRSTQVWEIKITDEENKLVCISRCTLAVVPLK
ncbi:MAG: hotdog fold thioesterase [Bdellovibrionales bacterium]|nr:hotdog fold thioesterase [Bdellovibrionales bacterium]